MAPFRRLTFSIFAFGVFLASTPTFGQGPAPAAPAVPQTAEARLDQVLNFWEQVTRQLTAFEATCNQTRTSARFGTSEKYAGTIRLLKGDPGLYYASLDLHRTDDEKIFEKLILNDRGLWTFDVTSKVINLHADFPRTSASSTIRRSPWFAACGPST